MNEAIQAAAQADRNGAMALMAVGIIIVAVALIYMARLLGTQHRDAFTAHTRASEREEKRLVNDIAQTAALDSLAASQKVMAELVKQMLEMERQRSVSDHAIQIGVAELSQTNIKISEALPAVLSSQGQIITKVEAESSHLDEALNASLGAHKMTQEQAKTNQDVVIAEIAEIKKLLNDMRTDMDTRLDALGARLDALKPSIAPPAFNAIATLVTEVPPIADVSHTPPGGTPIPEVKA